MVYIDIKKKILLRLTNGVGQPLWFISPVNSKQVDWEPCTDDGCTDERIDGCRNKTHQDQE